MKNKRMKIWLLILCLMIVGEIFATTPVLATADKRILSQPDVEIVEVIDEVREMRTENSKTYLLSDGTYQYVGYAEPIHYRETDGTLEEIDNQITNCCLLEIEDKLINAEENHKLTMMKSGDFYRYTNAKNAWNVYFKELLSEESAIMIQNQDSLLRIQLYKDNSVYEEASSSAEITEKLAKSEIALESRNTAIKATAMNSSLPYYELLKEDNRAIVYPDAVKNTDICYTVRNAALKEEILIKNKNYEDITFLITGTGVEFVEEREEKMFVDAKGNTVFTLGDLYAYDADGKYTENISYSIKAVTDGILCTIVVDQEFMTAEDTQYPVVIDPTIMVTGSSNTYDTCVDEQYPNSNYYLAESLWTGGLGGTNRMRTYIKFDLPTSISSSDVTNAYIHIKKRDYEVPSVVAYRVTENWNSNSITWNNKPEYTVNNPSAAIVLDTGAWYKITVTTMVKDWMRGTYQNYGFCIKEPNEINSAQKTKYYSSDAPSPNKPELVITYTGSGSTETYYGSREYQYATGREVNCMGYALETKRYITPENLSLDRTVMNGMTKNEAADYVASLADSWMTANFGSSAFGRISSYSSSINTGWYRVALRFGFTDEDGDGKYDDGEDYDYHWWYQTNEDNGVWAEKPGEYSSRKTSVANGANPAASTWTSGRIPYTSKAIYYKIKDIRTVNW